jgi:hypothetical protein
LHRRQSIGRAMTPRHPAGQALRHHFSLRHRQFRYTMPRSGGLVVTSCTGGKRSAATCQCGDCSARSARCGSGSGPIRLALVATRSAGSTGQWAGRQRCRANPLAVPWVPNSSGDRLAGRVSDDDSGSIHLAPLATRSSRLASRVRPSSPGPVGPVRGGSRVDPPCLRRWQLDQAGSPTVCAGHFRVRSARYAAAPGSIRLALVATRSAGSTGRVISRLGGGAGGGNPRPCRGWPTVR